jgi:hypothetical protein
MAMIIGVTGAGLCEICRLDKVRPSPFPGFCWVSGAVGMLALRASRGSSLLRLRVDVPDQPIKMRLERFTAFLRAVTPNVHGGWAYAEITRKFTFQA